MNAFTVCWCGCPPARHKVEPVKGQLRHTRCQRCRCTQYEPRVEEAASPAPDEEETAAAEDLALVPVAVVPAAPKPSGTLHPPPLVHGQRLGWWDAYQCLTCGGRTFLPAPCCGTEMAPVTVTVTYREVH